MATGAAMRTAEVLGLAEHAAVIWTTESMLDVRGRFDDIRRRAARGERRRLLFLVPPNNTCAGPLYEVVFMLETCLRRHGVREHVDIAPGPRTRRASSQEFGPRRTTSCARVPIEAATGGARTGVARHGPRNQGDVGRARRVTASARGRSLRRSRQPMPMREIRRLGVGNDARATLESCTNAASNPVPPPDGRCRLPPYGHRHADAEGRPHHPAAHGAPKRRRDPRRGAPSLRRRTPFAGYHGGTSGRLRVPAHCDPRSQARDGRTVKRGASRTPPSASGAPSALTTSVVRSGPDA